MHQQQQQQQTTQHKRLLYLVPTNCNPTAHTVSDRDRRALVAACARRGVVVVADEVQEGGSSLYRVLFLTV